MEPTSPFAHLPETEPGMVPTANATGFMFTELSKINREFIEFAAACTKPIVDIGCAYGVATLPAVARSECDVLAVDLSPAHLDALLQAVPKSDAGRVTAEIGRFPDAPDVAEGSVAAIHMSNMLHFLRGPEIERGLDKCLDALEPGGRLFIDTVALYYTFCRGFVPVYEARAAAGEAYPGEIDDLYAFFTPVIPGSRPVANPFLHAFKVEDLARVVRASGFNILDACYMDRQNLGDRYDNQGRGWVGIVAEKPAQ